MVSGDRPDNSIRVFYPAFLSLFRGENQGEDIRSGIEVVITSRTRNAVGGNPTRVRISPAPPPKWLEIIRVSSLLLFPKKRSNASPKPRFYPLRAALSVCLNVRTPCGCWVWRLFDFYPVYVAATAAPCDSRPNAVPAFRASADDSLESKVKCV